METNSSPTYGTSYRDKGHKDSLTGWSDSRGVLEHQDVMVVVCAVGNCRNSWGRTESRGFSGRKKLLSLAGIPRCEQQEKDPTVITLGSISGLLPHLCWALLQIRRHLHTAFIQEPQLPEEQSKLPQVFLQLSKAILVHCLALGHTIRKLNQRHRAFHISWRSKVLNISGNTHICDKVRANRTVWQTLCLLTSGWHKIVFFSTQRKVRFLFMVLNRCNSSLQLVLKTLIHPTH